MNHGDKAPRMKIVRYEYFAPWDWIVGVGSYEDEFYREANEIEGRIIESMVVLSLLVCILVCPLVFFATNIQTVYSNNMIEVIYKINNVRLEDRIKIDSDDEF